MKPLAARACPVCDADQPQPLHRRAFAQLPGLDGDGFTQQLAACGACGALYVTAYLDPQDLAAYYASMSSYEYLVDGAELPAEERLRSERQVAFLRPYLADAGTAQVLDVGCSTGHTLRLFAQLGHRVCGVEPSASLSAIARDRHGLDVATSFVEQGTVLPAGQHLVLLSHVLEHLLQPRAMLAAIRRALRPDGLLFIEVPVIELFDDRDLFQLSFEHVNYFSHGSLRTCCMRRATRRWTMWCSRTTTAARRTTPRWAACGGRHRPAPGLGRWCRARRTTCRCCAATWPWWPGMRRTWTPAWPQPWPAPARWCCGAPAR